MRAIILAAMLAGCAGVDLGAAPAGPVGASASADVINAQGARVGAARFTEGPRGVVIRIELEPGALSPGWHGAHLHEAGDCTDFAAGFKASGAHARHGSAPHGLLNPAGPEAGDLANLYAPAAGPILAELYAPGVTLGASALGERAPLRGPRGAALILHANADDHTSQPIGGAGGRAACAALTP